MNVEMIDEYADGSATYQFDLNWEERSLLLNLGIITAIKNGIEEGAKYVGNIDMGDTGRREPDSVHGEGEQPIEPKQS